MMPVLGRHRQDMNNFEFTIVDHGSAGVLSIEPSLVGAGESDLHEVEELGASSSSGLLADAHEQWLQVEPADCCAQL